MNLRSTFAATVVGALVLFGCSNDDFDLASVDHAARQRDTNYFQQHSSRINEKLVGSVFQRPGLFSYPILVAADKGADRIVAQLIESGADLSVTNSEGMNALIALMSSFREPKTSVVTTLLNSPQINIHAADQDGYTALHHAARSRGTNVLLLLLNAGAAPTRTNKYGKSPIDLASNPDKRELLRRLAVRQSVQDGIDEPRTE